MLYKVGLLQLISFVMCLLNISVVHASDQRLIITGSSTVAPLALEIAKRFEKLNQQVRIDVQTGGSSRGVADARSGMADIGMVSRALKSSESDLHEFALAQDGIALIVNKSNPIQTLSKSAITDIYRGNITHWPQLSTRASEAKKIVVVNKAEGRSTLELFLSYFGFKNSEIKAHVVIGDNQQGIKTVAGNPNAIGYVSVGAAEYEVGYGTPIKLLQLEGVEASVEQVKNGRFPLSRPLNFVTKAAPVGLAKRFIEYAGSAAVHDLVREHFFVPVIAAPSAVVADQRHRVQN